MTFIAVIGWIAAVYFFAQWRLRLYEVKAWEQRHAVLNSQAYRLKTMDRPGAW